MQHERHYTLEQATAARDWVAERVAWIRDARARLVGLGSRAADALRALDDRVGGAYPGRDGGAARWSSSAARSASSRRSRSSCATSIAA